MSDATSDMGARIARFRHQRGMTQEDLAEAAGISRVMVGLVERGKRSPGMRVRESIARALGVSRAELAGDLPVPGGWLPGVTEIRDLMQSPALLPGSETGDWAAPIPAPELGGAVESARLAYWDGRLPDLAAMLPDLITSGRAAAWDDPVAAARPLALACDLAAALMVHYGRVGLAGVCSERAIAAAQHGDDDLLDAFLRGTFAWVLMHQNPPRLAEAEALAVAAADGITRGPVTTRERMAARGSLLLTALAPAAAAERGDPGPYLAEARRLAARLGTAVPVILTRFSAEMTEVQAVHAHAVRGEPGRALKAAGAVHEEEVAPVTYGRHLLDVAQALTDWGRDQEAIAALAEARAISHAWWRQQGVASLLVAELSERARQVPPLLRDLAAAMDNGSQVAYYRPAK